MFCLDEIFLINIMPNKKFFRGCGPYKIDDLVQEFGGKLVGEGMSEVIDVATLKNAKKGELSFFSNARYLEELSKTEASFCILEEANIDKAPSSIVLWITSNPYEVWAKILNKFYPNNSSGSYISPSSYISNSATIGKNVYVGHGAFVGECASISDDCHIGENCYIGNSVVIGANTKIHHGSTVTHSIIGSNCILHPGVRIGQDGFGFAPSSSGMIKVPQLGTVVIGSNVEIGANTCIDRGAIEDTCIGDYTKIDNLVQIGHNVNIGKYCIVVSQTGIAGSTTIGDGCIFGGQSGVAGHLKIGRKVTLAARGGIIKDVKDGEVLGGTPAVPIRQWHKQTAILKKLSQSEGK